MPDYKLTELLMHYITKTISDLESQDSVQEELDTLRQSLMRLESTVERFNEALRKETVPTVQNTTKPVRYEYKTFSFTGQINDYAEIGYRLVCITDSDENGLLIVMEREVPSEELEDDIFNLTYKDNGKAE